MSHAANLAIVAASFANPDPSHYAPDHKYRDPQFPGKTVFEAMDLIRKAMPDASLEVLGTVAEDLPGDKSDVVTRFKLRGTHTGDLLGIPPTGKKIEVNGFTEDHVKDGKITKTYTQWDALGALQDIGVAPDLTKGEATTSATPPKTGGALNISVDELIRLLRFIREWTGDAAGLRALEKELPGLRTATDNLKASVETNTP